MIWKKYIEKDIKEFYFNLLTLKNKKPFNEIEKDCKDIANFIYFMELLIDNINIELYDAVKHKMMQKITVLCLFVFFIFYMIHFERKIKKKNDQYFIKNGLNIEIITNKISEAKKYINKKKLYPTSFFINMFIK